MNLITSLTARIEDYRATNKQPCKNIAFVVVSSSGKIMDQFKTLADAWQEAYRLNAANRRGVLFWADEYPADALAAELGE